MNNLSFGGSWLNFELKDFFWKVLDWFSSRSYHFGNGGKNAIWCCVTLNRKFWLISRRFDISFALSVCLPLEALEPYLKSNSIRYSGVVRSCVWYSYYTFINASWWVIIILAQQLEVWVAVATGALASKLIQSWRWLRFALNFIIDTLCSWI